MHACMHQCVGRREMILKNINRLIKSWLSGGAEYCLCNNNEECFLKCYYQYQIIDSCSESRYIVLSQGCRHKLSYYSSREFFCHAAVWLDFFSQCVKTFN